MCDLVPLVGVGKTLSVTCMSAGQSMRVGLSSTMRQGWWGGKTAIPRVTCLRARQVVGVRLSSSIWQHKGGVGRGTGMNTSKGWDARMGGMDYIDYWFTIVSWPRVGLQGGLVA